MTEKKKEYYHLVVEHNEIGLELQVLKLIQVPIDEGLNGVEVVVRFELITRGLHQCILSHSVLEMNCRGFGALVTMLCRGAENIASGYQAPPESETTILEGVLQVTQCGEFFELSIVNTPESGETTTDWLPGAIALALGQHDVHQANGEHVRITIERI